MSTPTRESPFEFEGVNIYRDEHGWLVGETINMPGPLAQAIHAFIEAEREGWHWTNDDHTEARNGGWTVEADQEFIHVTHADLPGEAWSRRPEVPWWDSDVPDAVRAIGASFLSWERAQDHQPLIVTWSHKEPDTYHTPCAPEDLPLPEVGEWVWVEYRYLRDGPDRFAFGKVSRNGEQVFVDGEYVGFRATRYVVSGNLTHITAWGLIDPADLEPESPDLDAAFQEAFDALNRLGSTMREAKS